MKFAEKEREEKRKKNQKPKKEKLSGHCRRRRRDIDGASKVIVEKRVKIS